MNRWLPYIIGPETVLVLLTGGVFWMCARHASYGPRDVHVLERMLWLLPVVAVVCAYATILVTGAKTWGWLARVNIALLVAVVVCAVRIIEGFKEPGTGPNGGDIGLLLVVCLWIALGALANGISAALILAEHRESFAAWFHSRKFLGSLLTVLAAVPFAMAMAFLTGIAGGLYLAVTGLMKR